MGKKSILVGGGLVLLVALFMFNGFIKNSANIDALISVSPSSMVVQAIAWFETIFIVSLLAFGLWDYTRPEPRKIKIPNLAVVIPGHFLIALLPVGVAFFLTLLGLETWGTNLACLSFPALLVFVLIGLAKAKDEGD